MKIKRLNKVDPDIPNASMSDIAFLLLIFFILTSAFASRKGIDFRLPLETDDMPQIEEVTKKAITIDVLASGRILLDTTPSNVRDIEGYIKPWLEKDPDKFVIIKVDDAASYGDMISVLDELKGLNVKNIALPSREEIKSWM